MPSRSVSPAWMMELCPRRRSNSSGGQRREDRPGRERPRSRGSDVPRRRRCRCRPARAAARRQRASRRRRPPGGSCSRSGRPAPPGYGMTACARSVLLIERPVEQQDVRPQPVVLGALVARHEPSVAQRVQNGEPLALADADLFGELGERGLATHGVGQREEKPDRLVYRGHQLEVGLLAPLARWYPAPCSSLDGIEFSIASIAAS